MERSVRIHGGPTMNAYRRFATVQGSSIFVGFITIAVPVLLLHHVGLAVYA